MRKNKRVKKMYREKIKIRKNSVKKRGNEGVCGGGLGGVQGGL